MPETQARRFAASALAVTVVSCGSGKVGGVPSTVPCQSTPQTPSAPPPAACTAVGKNCGTLRAGGTLIDCGGCPVGQTCGGGGTPNVCAVGDLINPPPDCLLDHPAFCDNFQTPSPGGRAGDLDDTRWSFSRFATRMGWGGVTVDPIFATDIQFCKTFLTSVAPPGDSFFCNGAGVEPSHWMDAITSTRAAGYNMKDARIRQPFDFTGRTGTIAFQVDAKNIDEALAWLEVWISEDPVPGPRDPNGIPAGSAHIKNAVGFVFDDSCGHPEKQVTLGEVKLFDNYDFSSFTPTQVDCANTVADGFNAFEIRISQSHVEVWGSDYSPDHNITFPNFRLLAKADLSLPFTRGYVHLQHGQFGLYDSRRTSVTYHWLGVGFDGPILPVDRAYDVPDAMSPAPYGFGTNVGYRLPTDGSSGMQTCCTEGTTTFNTVPPFVLSGVDLSNVTDVRLDFAAHINDGCYVPAGAPQETILYRFNGGAWRSLPWKYPDCGRLDGGGTYNGFSVPVALTDLVPGTDTLELSSYDDPDNPPFVANIDLTLRGNFAPPPAPPPAVPETRAVPVPAAYPPPDPSLTARMQLEMPDKVVSAGQVFAVPLTIDGGGQTIEAAAGFVYLSENLALEAVQPGDCGFDWSSYGSTVIQPTTSDPSFAGQTSAGKAHCTVYTLEVGATAPGRASIVVTSGSVQTANEQEILRQVNNAHFDVGPVDMCAGAATAGCPLDCMPHDGACLCPSGAYCPSGATSMPTWSSFGQPFVQRYCQSCHSASLSGSARNGAPPFVNLDTLDDIHFFLGDIDIHAAGSSFMPPVGTSIVPSDSERQTFAEWLACGAPGP